MQFWVPSKLTLALENGALKFHTIHAAEFTVINCKGEADANISCAELRGLRIRNISITDARASYL